MKKIYEKLYIRDKKNKPRVWWLEQNDGAYRAVSGIDQGKMVTSDWTYTTTTNEGRSNERDPIAQATFEIESIVSKMKVIVPEFRSMNSTFESLDN